MEYVFTALVVYFNFLILNLFCLISSNLLIISLNKKMGIPNKSKVFTLYPYSLANFMTGFLMIELMAVLPEYMMVWITGDKRIPKKIFINVSDSAILPDENRQSLIENESFLSLLKEVEEWKLDNDLSLEKPVEGDIKLLYNMIFEEKFKPYKELLK